MPSGDCEKTVPGIVAIVTDNNNAPIVGRTDGHTERPADVTRPTIHNSPLLTNSQRDQAWRAASDLGLADDPTDIAIFEPSPDLAHLTASQD